MTVTLPQRRVPLGLFPGQSAPRLYDRGGRGVRSPLEGLGSLLTPEPNLPPVTLYGPAGPGNISREKPKQPP